MAKAGTLTVKLLGDSGPLEKTLKNTGGKLGSFVKGVSIAGAAAVGLLAAKGVEAAREATKINRLTEQVLKTTGGAANVSMAEIEKLNNSLQATTGISDDLINEGQNLLLTFTNIRNEVGKGNDVFDQATVAATNMHVALGVDMKSASIQLGKALNDPIKGITALSRAGVSFTEQQKEQIKTLTEAGDVLGAQKIILGELEVQFGGAAEAAADPMQKLRATIDDVVETVGMALLPIVDKAATWLAEKLPGAIDRLMTWFTKMRDVIVNVWRDPDLTADGFIGVLERVVVAARGLYDWWQTNSPTIIARIGDLKDWFGRLGSAVVSWWVDDVQPRIEAFVAAVREHWPKVEQLFQTLGEVVGNIGRIFKTELSNMSTDTGSSTESMSSDVGTLLDTLNVLAETVQVVTSGVASSWNFLSGAVAGDTGKMWKGIDDFTGGTVTALSNWADSVRTKVSVGFNLMSDAVAGAVNTVIGFINRLITAWNNIDLSLTLPKLPDWMGGGGGQTLSVSSPNIPTVSGIAARAPSIPSGARALGGAVLAGGSFLVGERGPEVFTPSRGGSIVPNHDIGGAGMVELSDRSIDRLSRALLTQLRSA